ncbi:MAG: NUDIX domain-containing protein [Candidatus Liptonbacteria bacterium]|nr:NUDIX domain-containing protein [Candidatus Liptonbacteria bacterium]
MHNIEEKPKIKVAGCFLEHDGRFLILQRCPGKSQGGKWGLPAGRVEQGETERDAVIREIREETGFSIPLEKLEFLQEIVFEFPQKTTDFFVYRVRLGSRFKVSLELQEHQACAWVTGEECYARDDLINGVHGLLEKTGYA